MTYLSCGFNIKFKKMSLRLEIERETAKSFEEVMQVVAEWIRGFRILGRDI